MVRRTKITHDNIAIITASRIQLWNETLKKNFSKMSNYQRGGDNAASSEKILEILKEVLW